MSLIGDALKRTQETSSSPLDKSATTTLRLKPSEPHEGAHAVVAPPPVMETASVPAASVIVTERKSSGLGVLFGIIVIVFAIAGVVAFVGWKEYQKHKASMQTEMENALKRTTVVPIEREKAVVKKSQASETVGAPATTSIKLPPPPLPQSVAHVVVSSRTPRPMPKLTLQGVTVQAGIREALINGQTLQIGEEIEGARVTAIEKDRIKVLFDGREVVLPLF